MRVIKDDAQVKQKLVLEESRVAVGHKGVLVSFASREVLKEVQFKATVVV